MRADFAVVRGFTLIELPVFIAIIAMLAALLLPVLRARKPKVSAPSAFWNGQTGSQAMFYNPPTGYNYQWSGD
jgi:Tfp pilus assembly protein PilE